MRYPAHTFEDFAPGLAFACGPRIVTAEDIATFARISGDHTRLHTDAAYAATTPFGRIVAHGALNLAVATGLAYESGVFEGTVLAVAEMDTRFERPVFPGDPLTLRMIVAGTDPRPRPDSGKVTLAIELLNGTPKVVLRGQWTIVVRRAVAPGSSPA